MYRTNLQALRLIIVFVALLSTFSAMASWGQSRADDATQPGTLNVGEGFYGFDPAVDPDVLADRDTQIAAEVYYPMPLSERYPVLIFLHGNHGTCGRKYDAAVDDIGVRFAKHIDDRCDFTDTGGCPMGYITPLQDPRFRFGAPSHLGYEYLARRMASNGYVVISINANRGITCAAGIAGDNDLIFARGRLVLKHLEMLSSWDLNGGTPGSVGVELDGHLDFGNVGLMGHSRGGEGVRAAYNLYSPPLSIWRSKILEPVNLKGVFEIGPTDNTPADPANNIQAEGTVWNVLLPMCDGDVSNLAGVKPFDRMMANQLSPFELLFPRQKSTYTVWGANHNFYNTEWQVNENYNFGPFTRCAGPGNSPMFADSPGSLPQRLTGLSSLVAFFRANVGTGANNVYNRNFNTLYLLPVTVWDDSAVPVQRPYPRRVDRGFTISPSFFKTTVFDDFNKATGINSYNVPNDWNGIGYNHQGVPNHDPIQRAANVSWPMSGANVFLQTNWTAVNDPGRDISAYKTLDIRLSREDNVLNPVGPTDFSIQLVGANGVMTRKLRLSTYGDLRGPVGSTLGGLHPILQTVRIPLTDFGNYAFIKGQVRGVRFTFDRTGSGAINIANVRLSFFLGSGVDTPRIVAQNEPAELYGESAPPSNEQSSEQGEVPSVVSSPAIYVGHIQSLRAVTASPKLLGREGVEIEVTSATGFPVRDLSAVLRIGSHDFTLSGYRNGDLHTLVFYLTREQFDALSEGEQATVQYGRGTPDMQWVLGRFYKGMLNRGKP